MSRMSDEHNPADDRPAESQQCPCCGKDESDMVSSTVRADGTIFCTECGDETCSHHGRFDPPAEVCPTADSQVDLKPRELPPCPGFVNDPAAEWDGNLFCICGRMRQAHS